MKPDHPGNANLNGSNREVDSFTALLAIIDFVDNEMPKLGSIAELRTALVIWRQTHGWGKLTDSIGIAQLAKQTATDAKAIQRALSGKRPGGRKDRPLAEKIGIVRHEQKLGAAGDLERTRYTWPVNERVRAKLEKAALNQSERKPVGGVQVTPTPGEQITPTRGGKIALTQSCTINLIKESSSSESALVVQVPITTTETTDDEPNIHFEKTKREDPAIGTVPAVTAVTGNPDAREPLVEEARQQLQMARAAGLNGTRTALSQTLAATRPPDRAITIQILDAFSDYADFLLWLQSTVNRGVARKAISCTWGLYLTDARIQADDLKLKRQVAEQSRIESEIARERQRVRDAVTAAEVDQPIPGLQALSKVEYSVRRAGRALPRPLEARLKRTGELISPNELARQILDWKRCSQCGDSGTYGVSIDKTLAFCECPAAAEAAHSKGVDWPAQEIARVHTDAKSLLMAACLAVGCPFAADTIEDSKVSDGGGVLEISLPDGHFGIDQGDVCRAVERLKWQRRIVITGGRQQPRPALAARPAAVVPVRLPTKHVDIDAELTNHRQKIPPQMEAGCDIAVSAVSGDIR